MCELCFSGSNGFEGQIMTQEPTDLRQVLYELVGKNGLYGVRVEAAHTKIVELVMDMIGGDEQVAPKEKHYYPTTPPIFNEKAHVRNKLRSQLRQRIKEL